MKRTALRSTSKKRQRENRQRKQAVIDTFGEHPACHACPVLHKHSITTGCDGQADDAHELTTRGRGGSITDPTNIIPVGRRCHMWIDDHPKLAEEYGLIRPSQH